MSCSCREFWAAAEAGDVEVVRGCLRDGADPNFALYWAAGKRLGGRRHSVRLGPIRLMIAEVRR